jgi:hypothetical protein
VERKSGQEVECGEEVQVTEKQEEERRRVERRVKRRVKEEKI